jgi:Flp pilus assembly protein TadB
VTGSIINRAAERMMAGSKTPFADASRSYSDDELCALGMEAKNFLAECLYEEAKGLNHAQLPWVYACLALAIPPVIALVMGYTIAAIFLCIPPHAVMWLKRKRDDQRSAHELRRVVEWMKYENEVTKAVMEGLK